MESPHWLMLAGAVLVVVGLIGLAFRKNYAEPVENNPEQATPANEPNLERPRRRRTARGERDADREQAKREAEHEGQRGMSEPNKLNPTPGLPDDTLISDVEFPAHIRKALTAAGLKTVGELRETSDDILLSSQDLGRASVARLREKLGLRSTDGVRPPN
jgi:Bacterial RNA polymerase, alpha chain C terminal domain